MSNRGSMAWIMWLSAAACVGAAGCVAERQGGDAGDGSLSGATVSTTGDEVAVVNSRCPVMREHELPAMRVRAHKVRWLDGRAVGFCCEECLDAWASMSDAERREAVKAVTPPAR